MPHSTFKGKPRMLPTGAAKCPCGQTFKYESDSDWKNKIWLHKKFCDKIQYQPRVVVVPRQSMKAITQEEAERMVANNREFRM